MGSAVLTAATVYTPVTCAPMGYPMGLLILPKKV